MEQAILNNSIKDTILNISYSQLSSFITSNSLVIGKKYLITDYQTVHIIPGTPDINTGPIEPLIVTALKTDELEPISYSTLHVDDIIYYDPLNNNAGFPGSTKGYISRRIDTIANNDIGTDWRYCKYRRYKITEDPWDAGTTYSKYAVVKHTITDLLYLSRIDNNLNNPVTNNNFWVLLPTANDTYSGLTPNSYVIDNVTITTSAVDYEDHTLFVNPNTLVDGPCPGVNNTIRAYELINTVFYVDVFSNNIIQGFFRDNTLNTISDGGSMVNFFNNTFQGGFLANLVGRCIGNNAVGIVGGNLINNGFSYNNIMQNLTDNIIGPTFIRNRTNFFKNNIIVDSFLDNNIKSAFTDNNIGANFYNNEIINYTVGASARFFRLVYTPSDTIGFINVKTIPLDGTIVAPYDFTGATLVFLNTTKEIFARPDGTVLIKYIDDTNTTVITDYIT